MPIIRRVLKVLGILVLGGGLLGLAVVSPYVQTWTAKAILPRMLHGDVELGSIWASFGRVQVSGFKWRREGITLSIPELEADVPLIDLFTHRRANLQRLVSHGWTITMPTSAVPPVLPSSASVTEVPGVSGMAPASEAPGGLWIEWRRFLRTGALPGDLYIGSVDMDGSVEFTIAPGAAVSRAHVTVLADDAGKLTVDSSGVIYYPGNQPLGFSTKGELHLKFASPHALAQAVYTTSVVTGGKWATESDPLRGTFTFTPAALDNRVQLEVTRDKRSLVRFALGQSAIDWDGSWSIDLEPGDVSRYFPENFLPEIGARGDGKFKIRESLQAGAVDGRLTLRLAHLERVHRDLRDVPPMEAEGDFQLEFDPAAIRSDRLNIKLSTARPVAALALHGAAGFDWRTHAVSELRPGSGLDLEMSALPLAWLRASLHGLTLDGAASGKWRLHFSGGYPVVDSIEPLLAEHVTVSYSGHPLAKDLGLHAVLSAQGSKLGWKVAVSDGIVTRGGSPTMQFSLVGEPGKAPGSPYRLTYTGREAMDQPGSAPPFPIPAGRITPGSVQVEVTFPGPKKLEATVEWASGDGEFSVAGGINAALDPSDYINFDAPLKIVVGARESELEFSGKIYPGNYSDGLRLTVKGGVVYSEDLALPWHSLPLFAPAEGEGAAPATLPFWGGWRGNIDISCDELHLPKKLILEKLHADLALDHKAARLGTALYTMPDRRLAQAHGDLLFDSAHEVAYSLRLDWTADSIDGETFFGYKVDDENAPVHGKFTLATSLQSTGRDPSSLLANARRSYTVESQHGIVRLLRSNLGDAVNEKATPVSDAVGTVGNAFGRLLGHGRGAADAGVVKLDANTEAILRFGNFVGELEFDRMALKARDVSPTEIALEDIVMSGPEMEARGHGTLTRAGDRMVRDDPVDVTLQFAIKDRLARLLENSALLESKKDELGYFAFKEPVRLAGTPRALDLKAWHDLLAAAVNKSQIAATRKK